MFYVLNLYVSDPLPPHMDPLAARLRAHLDALPSVQVPRKKRPRPRRASVIVVRVAAQVLPFRERALLLAARLLPGEPPGDDMPALLRRLMLAAHPDRGGRPEDFCAVLRLSREIRRSAP